MVEKHRRRWIAACGVLGPGRDAGESAEAAFRTLLVAAVGASPLMEPRLAAACETAVTLSAIAVRTQKERRAAMSGGNPLLTLSPVAAQSVNLPGQCWSAASNLVDYSSDVVARDEIYTLPATFGASGLMP